MSYVDLATLTMHRRNELEGRINTFMEKCDHAINELKKMKMKAQGFILQLNCDPAELKDRFLKSMTQLDEFTYLVTDFNLSIGQIENKTGFEDTPVSDRTPELLPTPPIPPFNLLDALSEISPSTSQACPKQHPPEKPKRLKHNKEEQTLITFSSTSCSSESMPLRAEVVSKEVQCEISNEMQKLDIQDNLPNIIHEPCKLPAQSMLEVDHSYSGTIMHVDGTSFWVITDNTDVVYRLIVDMTEYYTKNYRTMSLNEIKALAYCTIYDGDCNYRGLFLNLIEDGTQMAEVYLVDTGETRCFSIDCIQPLARQFCNHPPFARCCHLAGIDFTNYNDVNQVEKLEELMRNYVGTMCTIEIDDNSSESLGVYVVLPDRQTLNRIIIKKEFANAIDKSPAASNESPIARHCVPEMLEDSDLDITQCPEYEDPVEAVTGYHNRDEADICKHYKGGPDKTCFKGAKCTKKHIVKHPDGWTLDRVEVIGKCKSLPLPEPGSWHKVLVTCVCHFDRLYVQIVNKNQQEQIPDFGVVIPPTTLASLLRDMNSPAAHCTYKPLKMTPAPGEMVAALYPMDNNWYRARVLSLSRTDQSVEVMYVDYGTVLWVKEDQVRVLEVRYSALPLQALRCVLAGVICASHDSHHWAAGKRALAAMTQDKTLDAHVIARDYDEVTVELFDSQGFSIAEQLAATNMVELVEYSVVDDTKTQCKIVVP